MSSVASHALPSAELSIAKLPKDWRIAPLGEFLTASQYGLSVKGGPQGRCPILRMTNQVNGRIKAEKLQYADVTDKQLQSHRVERGDLLFNRTNSLELVGRTAIFDLPGDYVFASYLIRLRAKPDGLDPEFLNFYLGGEQTQKRLKGIATRAVSQSNISATRLHGFPIPLPPLPEQKKIAHILSTVQRAIEAQERIIQTTTELKKALMHKLFTEGLRHERQKQTEIGPVPESWELLPLGDLFETQLGKMLSQKAKVGDSPKAYLRNKNVQWGRIDTDDLLRMDFSDREAEKFQLRKGDLLVCEGGEVGRAALWDGSIEDCYYQKALHRLRPKTDQITNEFMVYWMMFAFLLTNTYGVTGTRTTIAHLPEIKLKPLLVPVPSPDEQADIVEALETFDQKLGGHQGKFAALQDLFRTLLHELMTAKTRVASTSSSIE